MLALTSGLSTRLPGPAQPGVGRRSAPAPVGLTLLPAVKPFSSQGSSAGSGPVSFAAAAACNGNQPWAGSPGELPQLPYSVASADGTLTSHDGALPPAVHPLAPAAGEEGAQQCSRAPWCDELSSSESDSEHGLEPWKDDPYWTPDRPGMVRRFLGIGGS